MTSIAPIALHAATLTVCFPAPSHGDGTEMFAAYATGTATAEVVRGYVRAGGDAHRVIGVLLDAVSTGVERSDAGDRLLDCAQTMHAGQSYSAAALEVLAESCEAELMGDAVHEALLLGHLVDAARGEVGADAVVEVTRQVAMLTPFVDDEGTASKRGRVLANALRALASVGA